MAYEKHTVRPPESAEPRPHAARDASESPRREACGSHERESVVRTPQPKVLARIPQADPPRRRTDSSSADQSPRATSGYQEPVEAPKGDRLPGFDGRMINQRLATRILIGGAVALLLVAIVPLAFRGGGDDESETADSSVVQPSWAPENPAPDATAAPSWQPAAPTNEPAHADASVPPDWPGAPPAANGSPEAIAPPWATTDAGQPGGAPKSPADDVQDEQYRRQQTAHASANRGQSLPVDDLPAGAMADQGPSHRSPMPDAHAPAGGYDGEYQAARPHPAYRQAARPERPPLESSTPAPRYGEPRQAGRESRYGAPRAGSSEREGSGYGSAPGYNSGEFTPIQPPPGPEPNQRSNYPGTGNGGDARRGNQDYAADRYRGYGQQQMTEQPRYPSQPPSRSAAPYQAAPRSDYSRMPAQRYSEPASPYPSDPRYGQSAGDSAPAAYQADPSASNRVTPAAARFRGDIEQPAVNADYDGSQRGWY